MAPHSPWRSLKSSPRPSLQLASVRIDKLAGCLFLSVWMAINPSNHSTLYTANAQGCRGLHREQAILSSRNLLSQLTSFLVFKIMAEGLPSAGCLPSLERQGRGREITRTSHGTAQSSHSNPGYCTRVIPISAEETEAQRGQASCNRACVRAGCPPVPHWAVD